MAQKDKNNNEDTTKFTYREFCSMFKRYEEERAKKESKKSSNSSLRYTPMAKFKKVHVKKKGN